MKVDEFKFLVEYCMLFCVNIFNNVINSNHAQRLKEWYSLLKQIKRKLCLFVTKLGEEHVTFAVAAIFHLQTDKQINFGQRKKDFPRENSAV